MEPEAFSAKWRLLYECPCLSGAMLTPVFHLQVYLDALRELKGEAASRWVKFHLLSGDPKHLIFSQKAFDDLPDDAADAVMEECRAQFLMGPMYKDGSVFFLAADACLPQKSNSKTAQCSSSKLSICLGQGVSSSNDTARGSSSFQNRPGSTITSMSGAAHSSTAAHTAPPVPAHNAGTGQLSATGPSNTSPGQSPLPPGTQPNPQNQVLVGQPTADPSTLLCQHCKDGKLRPALVVQDPARCNLTPLSEGEVMKVELNATEQDSKARCTLELAVCYHNRTSPGQLCVKVHTIHCSCGESVADSGSFYILEQAVITINVLQGGSPVSMDLFLNAKNEGVTRHDERKLRVNRILASRSYRDHNWLSKLKLSPEIPLSPGGTMQFGELNAEQQKDLVEKFVRDEKITEVSCRRGCASADGTALQLQRDPVATYLTNSAYSMNSLQLDNGNSNPILMKRRLNQSSSVELRCSAEVEAWKLVPEKPMFKAPADKTKTLQKHAERVVKERRRKTRFKVQLASDNCRIATDL